MIFRLPLSIRNLPHRLAGTFQNGEKFVHRFGTQHGDTRLTEIGDSLEHGRRGQMAAAVQDAPVESLQPPALPGDAAPAQIGGGTT